MYINYKKFIKNRKVRIKLLNMLDFIPDSIMVKLQYYIKTGRKCDLKHPMRYTEKLQWYKIYYRDPVMCQCVDKYEVRKYIASKGLENILIPLIGVYDKFDEKIYDLLPKKFVIKDTAGGGGNEVIVCHEKKEQDKNLTIKTVNEWLENNRHKHKSGGREWVYDSLRHRVIIEECIGEENMLNDYKFWMINGKLELIHVREGIKLDDGNHCTGLYSKSFKLLKGYSLDYAPKSSIQLEKPPNFDEMIKIAEILSADFPNVRVDLYNVKGKIYFGELTFFNASGYFSFTPDDLDLSLGKKFKLPINKSRK